MNIVFSHCTQSFPIKFSASNTKADFLARGLAKCGAKVTFINGVEGSDVDSDKILNYHGFDCYLFAKKNNVFLQLLINLPKLIILLARQRKKNEINILFTGGRWPIYIIQLFFAKLFGYKCVLLTQEWLPAFSHKGIISKLDCYLNVNIYGRWLDMIFPISHYLLEKNRKFNKPMHIIPILADFSKDCLDVQVHCNYFSYCAGAEYFRVLKMLLDAYCSFVRNGGKQKMILVLYGRKPSIEKIHKYVNDIGISDMVEIKQQISNEELLEIYRSSLGLFIPLDPNSLQDQARFSQKIAEYLSARRPIVTCNVGEIPYYFTDKKNAVIVDYNTEAFYKAMCWLSQNEDEANIIGLHGYALGKEYFDYISNGKEVFNFIKNNSSLRRS